MKFRQIIGTSVLLGSIFAGMAFGQQNIIEDKTIDVRFHPKELSLTCRMGLNGHSYISLNAPTLNKALDSNVRLKETAMPVLNLTSPFLSTSTDCQETNMELTKFIVASGSETIAHLRLSLIESTTTSFGITSRVLHESFSLDFNERLNFSNYSSILLEEKAEGAIKLQDFGDKR